jgi:hypothetical protein
MIESLEILLIGIPAARKEKQTSARPAARCRPVDPAEGMTIGRDPPAFIGIGRNGAAIESGRVPRIWMANSALLSVVTF